MNYLRPNSPLKEFLNREVVKNVLFYNFAPAVPCFPFKKWGNSSKVTFHLHSELFDSYFTAKFFSLETLSQTLSSKIEDFPKALNVLKKYQTVTINLLFEKYLEYWKEYTAGLEVISSFKNDLQSVVNWETVKSSEISKVLVLNSTGRLSLYQKRWVYLNSVKDLVRRNEEIKAILESLHPWLNLELYSSMKEKEENTRTNLEFEKELELAELNIPETNGAFDRVSR